MHTDYVQDNRNFETRFLTSKDLHVRIRPHYFKECALLCTLEYLHKLSMPNSEFKIEKSIYVLNRRESQDMKLRRGHFLFSKFTLLVCSPVKVI